MKPTNLLSIIQSYDHLEDAVRDNFFKLNNSEPREREVDGIKKLVNIFSEYEYDILNNYFYGYKIPQIGKEFDLLRVDKTSIINIELKSESTVEKITKQLVQNRYYLEFLEKDLFFFTYVSNEDKLYELTAADSIVEVKFEKLMDLLSNQTIFEINDFDTLFNPSNYLVSPFNSTESFINREYFLTNHQKLIKDSVLKLISEKDSVFISISGKAGTGKTLLTYDIAKEVIDDSKKALIIHSGNLNQGQRLLNSTYNWTIKRIKDASCEDFSNYDLVIIDEYQRADRPNVDTIIENVRKNNNVCIFAFDANQCLRHYETQRNNPEYIKPIVDKKNTFELKEKIRSNEEIANFIYGLFNNKSRLEVKNKGNVDLVFFREPSLVINHLKFLKAHGWKVINYTPEKRNMYYDNYKLLGEDSAHEVIGQEFDKVVAVIDSHFNYLDTKLNASGYGKTPYYDPTKMLLQILSRTRKKLCIIVLNNEEVLSRCIELLK